MNLEELEGVCFVSTGFSFRFWFVGFSFVVASTALFGHGLSLVYFSFPMLSF